MKFPWKILFSLTCLLAIAAGCGGSSGKMVHGDGAKYYIEAMKVRTQDADKCLELLEKSVALEPIGPTYFQIAWIYAKKNVLDKAGENIKAGLELDPENTNLLWLEQEMKKPEKKRSFKLPPSSKK